ncbi:MAG: UvrD-helicase domain-containing protein [Bacteroidales bacterium]|nr:UvrD-helicase domain-containing protein [Bacteroidales bacterium]
MNNVTYISAGAGSGKTHKLTDILTKLILGEKVVPEEVILTTFTTKAADEFKEKAKKELIGEGKYNEAMRLDHAMIGTVHSVCQRMIGKYWFVLGLSPNMNVMAEEDTKFYMSQSLADLPTEEELKLLQDFAKYFDVRERDGFFSKKTIDYDFWHAHLKRIIEYATNYELDSFEKSEAESLEFIRRFVKSCMSFTITVKDLDDALREARRYVQDSNRIKNKDEYNKNFDEIKRDANDRTIAWYKNVQKVLDAKYGDSCAYVLERAQNVWVSQDVYAKQEEYIKLLFDLAKRWKDDFAEFKKEKNLLDYNDMEKYMRELMQNKDIAQEISKSYHYLFVDEFQDSSPIQVKIFDALSDLMEHSYWVGDYKQAIYGFRGSDIALTKAVVDRVSTKKDGCDTDTLKKSWRSLPDIVYVNDAVFETTFADVLDHDSIHLDPQLKNDNNEVSLRYFIANKDEEEVKEICNLWKKGEKDKIEEWAQKSRVAEYVLKLLNEGTKDISKLVHTRCVAEHILKLLNQGVEPNKIMVLARTNSTLADVANALSPLNIPSTREDRPVIESSVYTLVESLLRIVGSNKDALSKATVAILTEADYTTQRIIEEKILNDKTEAYLANVPLISRLNKIRTQLQHQSVASLVESMIIELNLYDVAKRVEQDAAFGISCLQTIINTARTYEEHCVQMNLPATIEGFLAYIKEVNPVGTGDANGVKLYTYHGCKGLEAEYVILMSLNDNVANEEKTIKNEIFGVHAIHTDKPTCDNPYPEVYIRLTPWIYGASNAKMPEEITGKITSMDDFKLAYNSMLAEENRLFYVAMTRPKNVLILCVDKNGSLLQRAKDVGASMNSIPETESGDWDAFKTGHIFHNFTLTEEEYPREPYKKGDETLKKALNIDESSFEKRAPRYLSPSKMYANGEVKSHHDFGVRIPFAKQPSDMATVGNCIHQIFAGIEEPRPAYKIEWNEIIGSYGLNDVLTDKASIGQAWKNLADYLTATHGAAVKTYHERPFRLERDGQTIVGSIDFVWQTAEGDILVDFKTNPMGEKAILDAKSDYYAGKYAGQLDAYQEALEAAGEKVVKRYVYYPVSGLLVEVGRA